MPQKTKAIPFELGAKVIAEATKQEDGCWVTASPVNPDNGYAYIKSFLVHRAAWVFANQRQTKPGWVIDHLCFNRLCVNPEHLRELTRRENSMRKTGASWPLGTCKWGHPDSDRVQVFWKSRAVRTECATCRKGVNDRQTVQKTYLTRLEYHYGLRLTRRQRAMLAEFMPELQLEDAA